MNAKWNLGRIFKINLVDIPWPGSILKCNQLVNDMQNGDMLVATLKDKNVKENLVLLLGGLSDVKYRVQGTEGDYQFKVKKIDNKRDHKRWQK